MFVAIMICAIILPQSVRADKIPFDPSVAIASTMSPDTLMLEDLTPNVWSVNPTVGYLTFSSILDESGTAAKGHGYGGTGEVSLSFGSHVGLSISGFGYKGSGDFTAGTNGGADGTCDISGWVFGTSLVLDPFSGKGFRMPFFLGLNYQHLASSMPTAPYITSTTLDSPGYTFGFSPRFSVGVLRFKPFIVISAPMNNATITCAAGTPAEFCIPIALRMLPVVGANIEYVPWNIGFFFSLSNLFIDTGASFYSFGPSFKF